MHRPTEQNGEPRNKPPHINITPTYKPPQRLDLLIFDKGAKNILSFLPPREICLKRVSSGGNDNVLPVFMF